MTVCRGSAKVTVLTDAGEERRPREEERLLLNEDREGAAAVPGPTAGLEGLPSEEEEDDRAGATSDGGSTSSGEEAIEGLETTSFSLKTTCFDITIVLS